MKLYAESIASLFQGGKTSQKNSLLWSRINISYSVNLNVEGRKKPNSRSDFIRVIQILLMEVGTRNFPKMKLVTVNSTLNFSKLQKETKYLPLMELPRTLEDSFIQLWLRGHCTSHQDSVVRSKTNTLLKSQDIGVINILEHALFTCLLVISTCFQSSTNCV